MEAAATTQKSKNPSWNQGDDIKLFELFKQSKVDPRNTKKASLDAVRESHFNHIPYRNFRTQFLKKSAQYEVDKLKNGANIPGEC